MNKFGNILSLFGVFAAFVSPAFALDLSLNDAIEKISRESHDLKKASANLDKAQASLDAANANRWFKLEGTATYMNLVNVERPLDSRNFELPPELGGLLPEALKDVNMSFEIPDNIFMAGLSLTQPLYTFGKIGNAVKSVKSAIKMAESSHELTRREVAYAATDLYWTAKMTDEIVKISESDSTDFQVEQSFIEKATTVSSLRLDSVVSAATGLSREKSSNLIKGGYVTVMYNIIESPSHQINEGDVFSVRGSGKFILFSINGKTKNRAISRLARFLVKILNS